LDDSLIDTTVFSFAPEKVEKLKITASSDWWLGQNTMLGEIVSLWAQPSCASVPLLSRRNPTVLELRRTREGPWEATFAGDEAIRLGKDEKGNDRTLDSAQVASLVRLLAQVKATDKFLNLNNATEKERRDYRLGDEGKNAPLRIEMTLSDVR